MAITPLPPAALPGALDAMTAQMAGMSAQTAYDTYIKDEYRLGNDQYVGYSSITSDKPAISGDTSGTIVNSQEDNPIDAWNDAEPEYDVPAETGGLSSGSKVSTFALSLMEKTDLSAEAVAPVAITIDAATVAISQALGVSMDIASLDVETKNAFIEAVSANGSAIYDKARNLVTAWKDSLGNILFPKSAVDSVAELIDEMAIGDGPSSATSELNTGNLPQPIACAGSLEWTSGTDRFYTRGSGMLVPYDSAPGTQHTYTIYSTTERGFSVWMQRGSYNGEHLTTVARHTVNGRPIYSSTTGGSLTGWNRLTSGSSLTALANVGYTVLYGNVVSESYPEGTSESSAPSYSPSQLIQSGAIMGRDGARTAVVPINIPDDPYNSTGSTVDPQSPTSDNNDAVKNPPIPGSIPDTNVSNPDVPLTDASVVNSTLINELVEELANTLDPQPGQSSGIIPIPPMPGIQNIDPDTGLPDGTVSFPSIVPASGSGFIHVYNPTPGEFVSFGNWLWVTYADATIDKIWNNPFDGVIGAHELYATPNRDGSDNIRSGFLTCPTTAALVRNRYTEIDCGTIIVPEFYGNYLDYSPYSQAYIYLPFIGINEVSIDDIVGHAVNVRYRVDSYTGSCIAMIFVAKDGYQNLCYQFAGSCSVEVPLAGGSQAAIKAGVLQAEAYARSSLASAALSGAQAIGAGLGTGGLAGGLMGGLSALGGMAGAWYGGQQSVEAARVANKSSVQHSGQFGASHGAMGEKIPFIIVRNPVQVKVVNYNDEYGYPSHKRVIIGGCTGYLRVREVNVISAHATDAEKAAIEAALKGGVYVS